MSGIVALAQTDGGPVEGPLLDRLATTPEAARERQPATPDGRVRRYPSEGPTGCAPRLSDRLGWVTRSSPPPRKRPASGSRPPPTAASGSPPTLALMDGRGW